jgi:hypothetical protein
VQVFEWPIGRPIDPEETVSVALVLHSRLLPDRSIGHFILNLQKAVKEGKLSLRDSLLDNNGRTTPVSTFFSFLRVISIILLSLYNGARDAFLITSAAYSSEIARVLHALRCL